MMVRPFLASAVHPEVHPGSFLRAAGITAVLLALGAGGSPLAAQTGSVTGRVVESGTERPLGATQVSLVNTGLGTITGDDGRFLILNVPVGTYTIRVERIGYTVRTQQVAVTAEAAALANFTLETEALGLDEIVVTGTAGAARRREVGNSMGQVRAADIRETPVNVEAILQSRIPGMNVLRSSAQVGGGSMIRLRGNVSVAMSNQPILYVDGVRVRSEGYARNVPPTGSDLRSNNDIASALNNINPSDIDRIEVIKGAAATTLYGTEAAAGVIQIFTKRGAQGAGQWTASIEQGFAHEQKFGVDASTAPPSEADTRAFCDESGANCATPEYLYIDPWLRDAWRQGYSLSVGGGGQALQYFVSGRYDHNEGVLPLDLEKKYVIRGNFSFSPFDQLQLQWNTSYTNTNLTNTPAGNNAHGITLNTFRRDRNYLQAESRDAVDPLLLWDINSQIDHLITGMTATYSPTSRWSNRLNVGYDLSQLNLRNQRPFGFVLAPNGILSDRRYEYATITADYVGSYDLPLAEDLQATLSWGGQTVTTEIQETSAYGEDFPGPGDPTVSSAGTRLGFEERERVTNAGLLGQAVFDFRNRYFLTVGARVDGNSAFGDDFGLQAYPRVSASYIISDEGFWPGSLGATKLRAAWGQSGRAPGAFDAVRTYNPVGWGTDPAFVPSNVGNPDIGPERTSELEFGFETSQFDNRITADFTYYHRTTSDALFDVRQIPSLGFLNSQLENIGEMESKGVEIQLNAQLIRLENFGWEVGGGLSTNFSKVTDLGGAPAFSLGNFGWVVEGQPVPVIRGRCVTNPDEIAAPIIEDDCNHGPNLPTHVWGVNTMLRFPANITLQARGEYQTGHYMYDGAAYNAVTRSVRWPGCFAAYTVEENQGYDALTAKQRAMCDVSLAQADFFVYPADFFKVRDVTATIPIPGRFVPGATGATLSLSGHNIYRWVNEDFPVFEPEQGANAGFNTTVRSLLEHVPPPATFTAALRLTF
jgi:TonB-linked SusC/RagA family outer membrane protein